MNRVTEARRLRKMGHSIREIEKLVPASRSSISIWVRDIELTKEQKAILASRNPAFNAVFRRSELHSQKFRTLRTNYQKAGRELAKNGNSLHLAGCMLYWAEGAKHRNTVRFSNTDVGMMKFFVRFLRECYSVKNDAFKVRVYCYTDKGKIEDFWLEELELPRSCLTKTMANYDSGGKNNKKRRKQTWGVCEINVFKTEIVQGIFGAIQEYSGFDNPEWIDVLPGQAGVV